MRTSAVLLSICPAVGSTVVPTTITSVAYSDRKGCLLVQGLWRKHVHTTPNESSKHSGLYKQPCIRCRRLGFERNDRKIECRRPHNFKIRQQRVPYAPMVALCYRRHVPTMAQVCEAPRHGKIKQKNTCCRREGKQKARQDTKTQ